MNHVVLKTSNEVKSKLTTEYRRLDGEKGFVRKMFNLVAEIQHAKVVRNAIVADLIKVCSTPAVYTVKLKYIF